MQRGSAKAAIDELRPEKRFKPDVAELFLSNTASADRAQRLHNNDYEADKEDIKPFVNRYKTTNQQKMLPETSEGNYEKDRSGLLHIMLISCASTQKLKKASACEYQCGCRMNWYLFCTTKTALTC